MSKKQFQQGVSIGFISAMNYLGRKDLFFFFLYTEELYKKDLHDPDNHDDYLANNNHSPRARHPGI